MADKNELQFIVSNSGLDEVKAKDLFTKFNEKLTEAQRLVEGTASITVTSEDQVKEMKEARAKRLAIRKVRIEGENLRKAEKEQVVRLGKTIDLMAHKIEDLCKDAEDHLETQEKFAEIMQAERKAKRNAERVTLLSPYVEDLSIYNLEEMEDERFEYLLNKSKEAHEARVRAEQDAEAERQRQIADQAKEQERIRLENEELKKQQEAQAKLEARKLERLNRLSTIGLRWNADNERFVNGYLFVTKTDVLELNDVAFEKKISPIVTELNKLERERLAKEEALRLESERQIAEERRKREEAEAAIEAAKQAEAKRLHEQEEAERQALLAPDKEKLATLVGEINALNGFTLPAVKSDKAQQIINHTRSTLDELVSYINEKAKEL